MQGMAPDAGMLRGEALLEEEGGERVVRLLCAEALPPDPAQRFAALFQARLRWELADLQPYLADLQVHACMACVQLCSLFQWAHCCMGK
jgi:hypothetical protein